VSEVVVPHYSGCNRYLRFAVGGDHAEVTSPSGEITSGFYGHIAGKLFGVYASVDGPMLIVDGDSHRFTSGYASIRVYRTTERVELAVVPPGFRGGVDIGPDADRETIRYLDFIETHARDRAKFVADYTLAGDPVEALSWARRAIAGDGEQFTAAVRATELDPDFPERALIARTVDRVAPWPGLRNVQRTTRIAARNTRGGATPIDLGSGVIAYRAAGGFCGVDILGRRVLWTSDELDHYRDDLWMAADGRVHLRDPLTGRPARLVDNPPPPLEPEPPQPSKRAPDPPPRGCFIDGERVHVAIATRRTDTGADFDVEIRDLARGTSRAALTHRGNRMSAHAHGDAVVLDLDGTIRVLDANAVERWSRSDVGQVHAVADGKIFAGAPRVQILDATDGRPLGAFDLPGSCLDVAVHPDRLLVATYQRAAAISRDTLEVLWTRDIPRGRHFATADALIVLFMQGSVGEAWEVHAIDPRDGATLAQLQVFRQSCLARTAALAAGKLVMLSSTDVVVVD
jgi:hypothetical protein